MTIELKNVLTTTFGNHIVNVVQAGESEPGLTGKQLGEILEYRDPIRSIARIHSRNSKRLDTLSVVVKLTTTDGKEYDTRVYPFKAVLEVCRYSNRPNAHAVMDWAWETLDKVRRGEWGTSAPLDGYTTMILANKEYKFPPEYPISAVTVSKIGDTTIHFGTESANPPKRKLQLHSPERKIFAVHAFFNQCCKFEWKGFTTFVQTWNIWRIWWSGSEYHNLSITKKEFLHLLGNEMARRDWVHDRDDWCVNEVDRFFPEPRFLHLTVELPYEYNLN